MQPGGGEIGRQVACAGNTCDQLADMVQDASPAGRERRDRWATLQCRGKDRMSATTPDWPQRGSEACCQRRACRVGTLADFGQADTIEAHRHENEAVAHRNDSQKHRKAREGMAAPAPAVRSSPVQSSPRRMIERTGPSVAPTIWSRAALAPGLCAFSLLPIGLISSAPADSWRRMCVHSGTLGNAAAR
jgi:hypothetical protein